MTMITDNIKHLTNYLAPHVKGLLLVFLALISVSTSLLAMGFVFRNLVDQGLASHQVYEVHNAIYLIGLLIFIFSIGSFFRSYFISSIALKIASKLKSDTYANLLKIDVVNFENLKIGDILTCLSSDIEEIKNLIINFLSFFIRNSIMLFGAIVLMFTQSPKLSLLTIFAIPILLFFLRKLSRYVRMLSSNVLEEQGLISASLEETLSGIRTLFAYNQQDYSISQLDKKIDDHLKHEKTKLKFRSLFFASAIMIISIAITFVIWVGSIDILKGSMSSGEMISFIYYAIIVGMSAGGIAEMFGEIQQPLAALDRVLQLKFLYGSYTDIDSNKKITSANDYSIKFDKVSFAYPSRPDIQVLNDISLDIIHAKFTGIVGKSGSGKSTLLQILIKFYKSQSGNIYVGDRNINDMHNYDLRSKIAYVEQSPTIFSGTIRSNIAFSKPNATNSEVEVIAKICGILEFAKELEEGLDSMIGEKGIRVSGGQKQRIAIARALLYEPQILLLDEATSALDRESEKKILKAVTARLKDKTIISIAHRLSSIESADKILVINDGNLESSGTHNELLKSSKLYSNLYSDEEKNI